MKLHRYILYRDLTENLKFIAHVPFFKLFFFSDFPSEPIYIEVLELSFVDVTYGVTVTSGRGPAKLDERFWREWRTYIVREEWRTLDLSPDP